MPSGPRIRCASGNPAAMQRKHRDNSQRAFPLASVNSDIASREATPPPDPGDPRRLLWIEAAVVMIAVDTLVHNFLHRTGILAQGGRAPC
jgi:hypothetical protein